MIKNEYLKDALKTITSVQDDMEYLICDLTDSNYEDAHDWAVDILDNIEQLKSMIERKALSNDQKTK